jgi:hypothetical protein
MNHWRRPTIIVTTLEREHGLHMTDDLKALYGWRNGSAPGVWVDLIPGMRFVSLQESARMRAETTHQKKASSLARRTAMASAVSSESTGTD